MANNKPFGDGAINKLISKPVGANCAAVQYKLTVPTSNKPRSFPWPAIVRAAAVYFRPKPFPITLASFCSTRSPSRLGGSSFLTRLSASLWFLLCVEFNSFMPIPIHTVFELLSKHVTKRLVLRYAKKALDQGVLSFSSFSFTFDRGIAFLNPLILSFL